MKYVGVMCFVAICELLLCYALQKRLMCFAGILWKFGIGSSLRQGAALGFNLSPFTAHFSAEVILAMSKIGLRYC